MPDREKVLRRWDRCSKCLYPSVFDQQFKDCEYTMGMYCRKDKLISETVELLKEQEAEISRVSNKYLALIGKASKKPIIVRCKDCCHWKPPHIRLNDGKQRAYKPGDKDNDPLGIGVSCDIGINVGGKCWLDYKTGYGEDKRVFRGENDFCSRANKLPEGMTSEQYWGLSEEPSELRDDFDY